LKHLARTPHNNENALGIKTSNTEVISRHKTALLATFFISKQPKIHRQEAKLLNLLQNPKFVPTYASLERL
jgi:hypothetical protein